jgi:lysozyme family protein
MQKWKVKKMANPDKSIKHCFKAEGGFSDHPSDRGGPTKYGITEVVARKNGYQGDMRFLPKEKARQIMIKEYWERYHLDDVQSQAVADILFDIKFNGGKAITWIQEALNVFNKQASLWDDITVDGKIGPKTVHILNIATSKRDGEEKLFEMMCGSRMVYFKQITLRREQNEDFMYGWMNRILKQRKEYYASR